MAEVRHNQGEAGGYLVGRRHSNGGIKAVNKSTGQPLEMEGGEVVITRDAVSDPKKRSFNGKMMTNRQILSEINQSGGGVAFAEGGEVPDTMHFNSDAEYEYGGKTMCGCDLATEMSKTRTYEEGGDTKEDDLAEMFQIEFDYKGWSQRNYSNEAYEINIQERGLFTILTRIMRGATALEDTSLTFDLNIRIVLSNGTDQTIPIIFSASYADLITSGGFDYDVVLADCVEKVQNSGLPNAEMVALGVQESQKMYFLSVDGYIYGTSDETIDADFRQEDFLEFDAKTADNALSHLYSVMSDSATRQSAEVEEKSNFKDWEKAVRLLNKETKAETGKPPTTMSIGPYIKLASLNDGYFDARMELFISTGKPFVTKWDWWRKNVFSKVNFFVKEWNSKTDRELRLTFSNVDFTPYEQELGNVLPKSRSKSRRDKAVEIATKNLKGKEGFTWINRNNYRVFAYENIEVEEILDYQKFDFYLRILYPESTNPTGNNSEIPQVRQDKIFFVGKDGIFSWSTRANSYFRGENFVVAANEEAKKAAVERKAAAEAARAAERKAAREAAKAEQERKEALKNRPFQVRDQPEDELAFSVNILPSTDPQIMQVERDLNALKKLASLTKGAAKSEMRRAILRKINGLTDRLNKLMLEVNSVYQMDREKLITPIGLMTYYFNQARQSPVKRMGEACKLDTPTGVPSKLDIQAYYAVRTAYFKKWFGDWEVAAATGDYSNCSMLVDADTKEPRIMYHGVRRFDPRVQTGAMGQGIRRPFGEFNPPKFPATYFGDSLDYVEFYAGEAENQPKIDPNYQGFIYSVFINMRNPIRIEDLGMRSSYKDLLAYIAIKYGVIIPPSKDLLSAMNQSNKSLKVWNYVRNDINLILTLKKAGYDGIIQYGDVPSFNPDGNPSGAKEEKEYLVFSANQVKSAVVKNSFYLPQFDDVRFKDGGHVRI
jgi:hypothetical protein